ncbi:Gfo/Idh/MocA family oxidoreductase [Jeotgalibaca sp. MA1X17-3]|uniref:Gfo/Idh/MocA family protein n=1 Tax=Jeotgalibaca sp. MA1X17-3 TaxID=2908211 RepID=UPI001F48BE98|nr:Gfo/Idh/MocA family oxidoreductase [Jeotgalibaca sp. MA1X17-3]UJF15357.1 Gfo/Idh/MocA family oxidoreductase [Jeotgalibaca sp. MA1X17-3]
MFAIGMIGTSSISHTFATALQLSGEFQMKAVYSRTLSTAKNFGKTYDAELFFDDLEEFMASPELDVVYIASPNSLHFSQTMLALQHGKHVIVEKPSFSNTKEWNAAFQLADEQGLFLFEAARHIHDPNYKLIKNEIAKMESLDSAVLNFGKYSSRYDQVLEGQEPNIFSLDFSGGAWMDLGIYLLYAAIDWFGVPESGEYFAKKIQTGVDGAGTAVLRYPFFDVTLHVSKMNNLLLGSEVHSGQQTLLIDSVSTPASIQWYNGEIGGKIQLAVPPSEHVMVDEAKEFARILKNPDHTENQKDYAEWKQLSYDVTFWLEKLRKEADIIFKADQ